MADDVLELPQLIERDQANIVAHWLELDAARGLPAGTSRAEIEQQCREFLAALSRAITGGIGQDIATAPAFGPVRELLRSIAQARAVQGLSSSDTATFFFSLKQPLFERIRATTGDARQMADCIWALTRLLDQLGLYTVEVFQKTREELVERQRQEIEELSTPVVKLWEGIVALPLIGTLDSGRTQVVMQNLLETIVQTEAEIAIIDITGVPTVDTLTAQHLLKTVSAARLMGADCIISGIRPQIAQTIVQLGVELNVVSKATLADVTRPVADNVSVRAAAEADVPLLLTFIKGLAEYEKLAHAVTATEQQLREQLFGAEDPIGKIVRVKNTPCKVVATMKPKGLSVSGQDQDDTIILP